MRPFLLPSIFFPFPFLLPSPLELSPIVAAKSLERMRVLLSVFLILFNLLTTGEINMNILAEPGRYTYNLVHFRHKFASF